MLDRRFDMVARAISRAPQEQPGTTAAAERRSVPFVIGGRRAAGGSDHRFVC
jgi:hypothetical protein